MTGSSSLVEAAPERLLTASRAGGVCDKSKSKWTDEELAEVAGFCVEVDIDPRHQTPYYDWRHDVAGHLDRGAGAIDSFFGTKSEYSKTRSGADGL